MRCLFKVCAHDTIQENELGNIESRERRIKHEDEGDTLVWDDVMGEQLNSKEVYRTRLKEMQYVRRKGIWKKITRAEAKERNIKMIKIR